MMKTKINNHKKAHFVGIKGSGMASLAHIYADLGYEVSGCDVSDFIFTEKALRDRGVLIVDFNEFIPDDNTVIIVGNSFKENHPEIIRLKKLGFDSLFKPYVVALGELIKTVENSIAVCGSHGKTTTTKMIYTLLAELVPTGYLIGDGSGKLNRADTHFVVEADEFEDHFLNYYPKHTIVTNIDLDHVDYFKNEENYLASFQQFCQQTEKTLILCDDNRLALQLKATNQKVYHYGFSKESTIYASAIEYGIHQTDFDLYLNGQYIRRIQLQVVGRHNLLNFLGALTMVYSLGFAMADILAKVNHIKPAKRRFEIENYGKRIYIDDYAHHPSEIKATLEAARLAFPKRKINLIYKPDRISRLVYFEKEFKESFSYADRTYFVDFPASAYQVDPWFTFSDLLNLMQPAATYVENSLVGAKEVAKAGDGVYIFVSTKDVYKFKDLVRQIFNDY